jgi:HEPN domain-containing protein
MRRKRNQFTYDPFLPVSKIEAENALKTAEEFVNIAMNLIQKENPQLRLGFND